MALSGISLLSGCIRAYSNAHTYFFALQTMPLHLDVQQKLVTRSERVKCVDFHPVEPWILIGMYSGQCVIFNHQTATQIKLVEIATLPVRAARFIPARHWIVAGADDMCIRVFNYNTSERIRVFEAHADYIRSLAVHPTLPLVLSSSDDMLIKVWNWERDWECMQVLEGHSHYVMAVEFNPKDPNTFASASLDRTVKVWGLNSPMPHFSLEGHERGANCVSYYAGNDKPYLISGADDYTVKVWDYQTKACVVTLQGHTNNVSAVLFHPVLPIIISSSEDHTVRIWHASTYRLENTLNYGMERVWTLACLKSSNRIAIGCDEGTIVIKIGHEDPVVSMDSSGKVVWARNHEIVQANLRAAEAVADGEHVPVTAKDLGSCELYPQSIEHSTNGRLLVVCGDGEYIVYTALKLQNKSFGQALEFVWGASGGFYATRENSGFVKVFKDFKEHKNFRSSFAAEQIFGGALLSVRSNEFVDFYDWESCRSIRRIDVTPLKVYWSETGDVVALVCDNSFFVLRYNADLVQKFLSDQSLELPQQGIENAFELESEISEKVLVGHFAGDCFIFTNTVGRLQYYVGGEVVPLAHLGKPLYLLGYLPKESRVYLMDKQHNVISYQLSLNVLIYQTAIVRRDFDAADAALKRVDVSEYNKIARFLEGQDLKEMALELSTDSDHRFDLAMSLKKYDIAYQIAKSSASESMWRMLGDSAFKEQCNWNLAEQCYEQAKDVEALLLLYSSFNNREGLNRLAELARQNSKYNVAFSCYFLLSRVNDCIKILLDAKRVPEACLFARTYAPSQVSRLVKLWKEDLKSTSETVADALADPDTNPELFEHFEDALELERQRNEEINSIPNKDAIQVSAESNRSVDDLYNGQPADFTEGSRAAMIGSE